MKYIHLGNFEMLCEHITKWFIVGLRGHSKIFSVACPLGTYVDFKNKVKYEDSQSYRPFGDD